jgi:Domain of unknown function (DUF4124)
MLLSGALFAAPASAQVYKCVDASGKPFYSQTACPPGQSSKVISSRPATPPAEKSAAAKPGAKPPANPEQDFRKRQKDQEEAEKKAAEQTAQAKQREDQCRRARESVAQYEMGGRFSRIDEKGERSFMDDAQIAQAKARAQALANESCK